MVVQRYAFLFSQHAAWALPTEWLEYWRRMVKRVAAVRLTYKSLFETVIESFSGRHEVSMVPSAWKRRQVVPPSSPSTAASSLVDSLLQAPHSQRHLATAAGNCVRCRCLRSRRRSGPSKAAALMHVRLVCSAGYFIGRPSVVADWR